jgi:hypothetical protein
MSDAAAANAVLELLLAGRYPEAAARLGAAGDALPPLQRAELAAHVEFHTARLRPSVALKRQESWLWKLLIGAAPGVGLVNAVFALAVTVLAVVGLRKRLVRRLTMRWLGDVIHYRYTNFARGLWQSLWLSSLVGRKDPLLRAYLRGTAGHFWGMSGRFDRSVRILEVARQELARASEADRGNARAYQYYCEILAIEALHKGYAGLHLAAKASFDLLFSGLAERPYWWIEIFARSMRMHVAMETVDETLLRDDALRLKRMLGTVFESKYALRTTAYSALIAAIKGNRNLQRKMDEAEKKGGGFFKR